MVVLKAPAFPLRGNQTHLSTAEQTTSHQAREVSLFQIEPLWAVRFDGFRPGAVIDL